MRYYVTGVDLILIIFYTALLLVMGYSFSRRIKNKFLGGYFIKGLALKLACGLGFGGIYVYYYGGGDTLMYFGGASRLYTAIIGSNGSVGAVFDDSVLQFGSPATIFTQRFAGFINLFAFNSYWACTLLFAALSFIGLWLLFLSFVRLFPHLHKPLAIVTLFIPGVVFWSSGIMKDTICMIFVGTIVYSVQNVFLLNRKKLFSSLLLVLDFYILIRVKAYIALAMLLAIALYAVLALRANIKDRIKRMLVMPIAASIILGGAFFTISQIGVSLKKYSLENLVETAQSYQNYHARTSYAGRGGSAVRTGSAYNLGEINYDNPLSILAKVPAAINVTFFRPYLWETRNPVMLLSALESTIILLFMLKVIRRKGFKKFIKMAVSNKEVVFCLTFALIFGFAVGFTTYNFGSLVRYKTPCIPFFLIALVIINASVPRKVKTRATKQPTRHPPVLRTTSWQPS